MVTLFQVQNTDAPPSSKYGHLRSGQKFYLVLCLETDSPSDFEEADMIPIDGASMVHYLGPEKSIKTFHDYAQKEVIPLLRST